jgi:hypothetical protein
MFSRVAVVVVPALALVLPSCGGTAEGLAPVTGEVVCDGQPAAGAILFFHRQTGEPAPPQSAAGVIPSATVRDDESFTVNGAAPGRGAAPGKYNVLIQRPETGDTAAAGGTAKTARVRGKQVVAAKHDKLDPVPADRLKGRHADSAEAPAQGRPDRSGDPQGLAQVTRFPDRNPSI